MTSTTCAIATVTNDIIVFTLISWKILTSFAMEEGYGSCFAYFCGKSGLPVISKILLRTGQQYFMLVDRSFRIYNWVLKFFPAIFMASDSRSR